MVSTDDLTRCRGTDAGEGTGRRGGRWDPGQPYHGCHVGTNPALPGSSGTVPGRSLLPVWSRRVARSKSVGQTPGQTSHPRSADGSIVRGKIQSGIPPLFARPTPHLGVVSFCEPFSIRASAYSAAPRRIRNDTLIRDPSREDVLRLARDQDLTN